MPFFSPMKRSRYALALLLAVNLLNYIDRQVLYAVFPLVKRDFALSDTALGLLGSAFMACYMLSAPVLGWLGDRRSRTRLASGGLVLWSAATSLAGFAPGYGTLMAARTAVGVGEASFGTVSPALLADYFPKEERGRVLSRFYLAIPVGSALGYLLGGLLSQRFGWRAAFLMVGLPGLLLALPVWRLEEPKRGSNGNALKSLAANAGAVYARLFRNRSFMLNTLAMAAMTFAMGGLAQWVPTFLYRLHGLDVANGNMLFGGVTVLAGIGGTLTGGWLGDRFQQRDSRGHLMVSAWGFMLGIPAAAWAILSPSLVQCLTGIFVAEFFLFFNTGPLNTVIVNVTPPGVRATAFAVNILIIHALGDALSPSILGMFSDIWGLRLALMITPAAIAAAAIFCLACAPFIAADMQKAEGQDDI